MLITSSLSSSPNMCNNSEMEPKYRILILKGGFQKYLDGICPKKREEESLNPKSIKKMEKRVVFVWKNPECGHIP